MAKSLAALKAEAIEMGLDFAEGVTAKELEALIKAATATEATAEPQRVVDVELPEEPVVVSVATKKEALTEAETKAISWGEKVRKAKEAAMKTRVVVVIDNDNRENNHTTTAPVNCSNRYFDLGTVFVPLNEPVEVMQGHIDVLKDVMIPQHVHDPKTGMSKVITRKRYTISYEDVK